MLEPIRYGTILICLLATWPMLAGTWFDDQTLSLPSGDRAYRYYVPDLEPVNGYRILFVLHGGGGSMNNVLRQANAEWPEIADEEGILLILPNGINAATGSPTGDEQHWNDCRDPAPAVDTGSDDVGFLSALIDWAIGSFAIDQQRVYAQGGSNGGMMSLRLASELPHRIAAIAVFIANEPAPSECLGLSHPKSIFICNGDAEDDLMPWDGGCVAGIRAPACRRGTVTSALETRDRWIRHNRVATTPQITNYPDSDLSDDSTVSSELFVGGPHGIEVMFYRVHGGGHTLPSIEHRTPDILLELNGSGAQNHDIEGAREAWAFLERHTLAGTSPATKPGAAASLRVRKANGQLALDWIPDCGTGSSYSIYRGDLAAGYGSLMIEPGRCDINGTAVDIPFGSQSEQFFLVVPHDGATHGSFGSTPSGARLSPSSSCYPSGLIDECAAP